MGYALTYSGSASPNLQVLQKKVQGNVLKGMNTDCEEWNRAKRLKEFNLDMSAREVTTPIDIVKQPSGSIIPEGGYEGIPRTSAPKELTFTWANYNDRYSYTLTSKYIDKKNRNVQIVRQAKYQTMKLKEGLVNRIGWSFYGLSDNVMAKTSTVQTATTGTYVITAGFGQTDITDTTYLASMFQVGDYVALVRGGTLVANAIGGSVTAVHVTAGLTIVWPGSVISANNDQIVFANGSGHTIITGTLAHSEYNIGIDGLIAFSASATVHGLATSAAPLWTAALADTSGGQLTGARLKKGQHEIANDGGGTPDLLIWSQGVSRNVYNSTSASVHFDDPLNMEIIGSVKTGGIQQFTSRKVPPGRAWMLDASSLQKWPLMPMPGEEGSLEGLDNANVDKLQDINAEVQSFDFGWAWICTNRGNIAYWQSLTES